MSATSGVQGSVVTLRGSYLGSTSRVAFNGAQARVVASASSLVAYVPEGATSGPVVVTTDGGSVTAGAFTVLPKVISVSPRSAYPGETLTLSGSGFTGTTAVLVGTTPCPSMRVIDDSTIEATYPTGPAGGAIAVVKGTTTTRSRASIARTLGVKSFAPEGGGVGTPVTLVGGGFTNVQQVLFGRVNAAFTVIDDATIQTTVPQGALASSVIFVVAPEGRRASSSSFSVSLAPVISSFRPVSAALPATVTVSGRNFSTTAAVSLGGTSVPFRVVSDLVLEVQLPTTVGSVTAPLVVTNSGGSATSARSFEATDLCAGVVCAASDQCHDVGSCDHSTGACSNPVKADGASCDDANACTQSDSCQAGVCSGQDPVVCTAQDQCHSAGACDPASGVCSNPRISGAACNVCTNAKAIATIGAGINPNAIALNPISHKVYVANYGDGLGETVTVLDPTSMQTATVTVGRGPSDIAVNKVTNKAYVTNYGTSPNPDNTVSVIDGATNAVTTITVAPNPYFVRVNEVTNRVYVTQYGWGGHQVTVIDGSTDTVLATLEVGSQPAGLAINPVTNKVYVANFTGQSVSVIDGITHEVSTVPTGPWPQYVAVNTVTNTIYTGNTHGASVTVIDGVTLGSTDLPVGNVPMGVSVNETSNKVYVANFGEGTLSVIDGATHEISTIALEAGSYQPIVDEANNRVFVTNHEASSLSIVDGATLTSRSTPTGSHPYFAVHDPELGQVFTVNTTSDDLTMLDVTCGKSWDATEIATAGGQNPSGPWSAGWRLTAAENDLTLYPIIDPRPGPGDFWCLVDPTIVIAHAPNYCFNPGAPLLGVNQGEFTLHGGCNASEFSVLRFTVPQDGTYGADMGLGTGDTGMVSVDVLVNTQVETSSGAVAGAWQHTLAPRPLITGDTIELVIGTGPDGCGCDTTPVHFVVSRE